MAVEIKVAEDEVDAILVFRAYQQMHAEGGIPGTLDDLKTLANIMRLLRGPGSIILMAMDGDNLVGVLSLIEEGYWYSVIDRHLTDKGFYVLPGARNEEAGKLLLEHATQASDDSRLPLYVTIFNGRRKRGGRSTWERLGATLGYHPHGAVLAHFPTTGED